jgi:hypothetical protein
LSYYRARYYDPTRSRFVSEDPIGLAGGVNTFAYAGDNPTNFRDPEGLHWMPGPRGPIPHRHNGTDGTVTLVHPKDSGAWPGDPGHYDPTHYPRPLEISHWVCELGVHAGCHFLCEGMGASPSVCIPACIAAAAAACVEECE